MRREGEGNGGPTDGPASELSLQLIEEGFACSLLASGGPLMVRQTVQSSAVFTAQKHRWAPWWYEKDTPMLGRSKMQHSTHKNGWVDSSSFRSHSLFGWFILGWSALILRELPWAELWRIGDCLKAVTLLSVAFLRTILKVSTTWHACCSWGHFNARVWPGP